MAFSQGNSKRLVAAFLQFLDDEIKSEDANSEKTESIDVTRQCLRMAYTTTAEDVPASQEKLLDLFTKHCPPPPERKPLTADEKESAEKLKLQGNEHMKSENYDEAIECYSQAISIDGNNAVFYCNRAAAHTGKQKFDLAITDCKKSLEIDPKYSKAFSRMGLTYSKMEIYDEAISCYKKALELDPENEGYKKNLQIAEEKQRLQESPQEAGAGFPGLEGFGAMSNFLNNPMFMNMAKQIAQNPQMQEMAMNMMSGMMGEQTGAAQQPDMSQILQMGQQFAQQMSNSNPELVEQLRSQMPKNDEAKGDTDKGAGSGS